MRLERQGVQHREGVTELADKELTENPSSSRFFSTSRTILKPVLVALLLVALMLLALIQEKKNSSLVSVRGLLMAAHIGTNLPSHQEI